MKDITSTTFGLIIAFVLPGLAALYGISFWIPDIKELLLKFQTSNSDVGAFLLVVLLATCAGLQISAIRWVVYECLICRRWRLTPKDFSELGEEQKLTAFRAAVDEHYRYHQFWGSMSLVFPLLYIKIYYLFITSGVSEYCIHLLAFINEFITILAAVVAYQRYVTRSKSIMKGD